MAANPEKTKRRRILIFINILILIFINIFFACPACQDNYSLSQCKKFKKFNLDGKIKTVQRAKLIPIIYNTFIILSREGVNFVEYVNANITHYCIETILL